VVVALFITRLAAHAQMPVVPGSIEATALGNAILQGIALGRFETLIDARRWTARPASPGHPRAA
jgi:sugar (pentulose or hexulose) kinase